MDNHEKDLEKPLTPAELMGGGETEENTPFVLLEDSENDSSSLGIRHHSLDLRYGVALEKDRLTISAVEIKQNKVRFLESTEVEIGGDGTAPITLAVRQAIKNLTASPRAIDLVLPAAICEYQVVTIPAMDAKERENYLEATACKAIGNQEACYAAVPLNSGSVTAQFLLVAAPYKEVSTIVKGFHKAGIIPERVLPPLLGALSLYCMRIGDGQGGAVVVDQLGQSEVNILVCDGGSIRVIRNIRKSSESDRWEEFLDSEVYRTVAFYRNSSGGKRVNRLYLVAADEEGHAAKQRFEAVGMFEGGVEVITIEGLEVAEDPLMALAAASAAAAVSSAPRMDLLPSELRNPKRRQMLGLVSISLAALAVLGELVSLQIVQSGNRDRQEALASVTALSEQLAHHEVQFMEMESRKSAFKEQIDTFDRHRRRRIPVSDTLVEVLALPPKNILLKGVELEANGDNGAFTVRLLCTVTSSFTRGKKSELDLFIEKLKSIPGARSADSFSKSSQRIRNGVTRDEVEIAVTFPSKELNQ